MAEKILLKTHPLPFTDNLVFYLTIFLLMTVGMAIDFRLFILACAVSLIVLLLQYFKSSLIITEQRITLKQGLLSRNTNDVYLADVGNIRISQTFIDRLLDVGTLEIASSATRGYEITVSGLPDPRKIKNLIEEQKGKYRT